MKNARLPESEESLVEARTAMSRLFVSVRLGQSWVKAQLWTGAAPLGNNKKAPAKIQES